jgi:hypothetical protein
MPLPDPPAPPPGFRWEDLRTDGTYEHNPNAPEVTPNGVNLSALRRNLRLSPTERIEQLTGWVKLVEELQAGMRRARR